MSVVNNNLLLTADAGVAPSAYQIQRSLRFNSADSAYLSRTPSVAGNRKTYTLSLWEKRAALNAGDALFSTVSGGAFCYLSHGTGAGNDTINFAYYNGSSDIFALVTTAVYRDPSSWYHIVLSVDTTQATASNRVKIYVNGVQVTQFSSAAYPALNYDTPINSTISHILGGATSPYTSYLLSAYLADVHFIDGQALTPSSFTETNATTGQLVPKAYTGSYGTNGFRLNFSDNSAATAATLGADSSGNGNNWTPNNLSVTAGAGNDSLTDTPTSYGTDTGSGGEVRGNYATLNPLTNGAFTTLSNGNLQSTGNAVEDNGNYRSTVALKTGKYYIETTCNALGTAGTNPRYGILLSNNGQLPGSGVTNSVGYTSGSVAYQRNGSIVDNGSTVYTVSSFGIGDVVGIAIDFDNGAVYFSKNNVWQNSGIPTSAGLKTGAVKTWTGASAEYLIAGSDYNGSQSSWNFGQRPFAYAAPSGFKALCDTNIAEGTITTSGTFTGNANANGPFVWLNGIPTAMTINSNAVTFATHVDKLANGFKVRSSAGTYNTAGTNTYSITTTGAKFKYARAQPNP